MKAHKIEIKTIQESFEFIVEEDPEKIIDDVLNGSLLHFDGQTMRFNPKYVYCIRVSKTTPPPY